MRLTFSQTKNNESYSKKTATVLLVAVLLLAGCGRRAARDEAQADENGNNTTSEPITEQAKTENDNNGSVTEIIDDEEKDLMKELLKESIENFNNKESYYMTGTHVSDDDNTIRSFIYEFVEPEVLHYTSNMSSESGTAMISEVYYQDINSPEDMDRNILPEDVDLDSIEMPTAFYNDKTNGTVYNDIYTGEPLSEDNSEQDAGTEESDTGETDGEAKDTFVPYTRKWLHVVETGTWSMSEIDKYKNPYANVLSMLLQRYSSVKTYADDEYVVYSYTIRYPSTEPFAAYVSWNRDAFLNDDPIELNVVVSKSDRMFINATTESKTKTGGTERFTVTVD